MDNHHHCETCHGGSHDAQYFAESHYITNAVIDDLVALCETDQDRQKLKELGFVRNAYEDKAGGMLSFAERKVNLASIERTFSTIEESFLDDLKSFMEGKKVDFIEEIRLAVETRDFDKLATIAPQLDGAVAKKYADNMKQLFETGKKTASDEMQVVAPDTDKDIRGLYRAQAVTMESKLSTEMAVTGQSEALYHIARGADTAFTLQMVQKALDLKMEKMITASTTQAMFGAFNTGRLTVFEKYRDRIYAFQYTAVIDRRTTNFCLSMNGRVINPDDPDFYRLSPPNHTKCRSFWVEVLNEEFIKPAIEAIPGYIPRDRTGLNNFQDLQKVYPYKPKSAMTPDEERIQRIGTLRALVRDLGTSGIKLKPLSDDKN